MILTCLVVNDICCCFRIACVKVECNYHLLYCYVCKVIAIFIGIFYMIWNMW